MDTPEYHYRNRHTGHTVTIIGAPILADMLYRDAEPWREDGNGNAIPPSRHVPTFGMEGRDGFHFLPQHWTRTA